MTARTWTRETEEEVANLLLYCIELEHSVAKKRWARVSAMRWTRERLVERLAATRSAADPRALALLLRAAAAAPVRGRATESDALGALLVSCVRQPRLSDASVVHAVRALALHSGAVAVQAHVHSAVERVYSATAGTADPRVVLRVLVIALAALRCGALGCSHKRVVLDLADAALRHGALRLEDLSERTAELLAFAAARLRCGQALKLLERFVCLAPARAFPLQLLFDTLHHIRSAESLAHADKAFALAASARFAGDALCEHVVHLALMRHAASPTRTEPELIQAEDAVEIVARRVAEHKVAKIGTKAAKALAAEARRCFEHVGKHTKIVSDVLAKLVSLHASLERVDAAATAAPAKAGASTKENAGGRGDVQYKLEFGSERIEAAAQLLAKHVDAKQHVLVVDTVFANAPQLAKFRTNNAVRAGLRIALFGKSAEKKRTIALQTKAKRPPKAKRAKSSSSSSKQ